jgi:arabinose-5-phosphate isomerase
MESFMTITKSDLILDTAREVGQKEVNALNTMISKLNGEFIQAVEILQSSEKLVPVVGMGKSGHIGTKIAATLSSTGTPAFAVHPGEGSHGDLGMLKNAPSVIMISHSGNTRELSDAIAYCLNNDIPIIAICGKRDSKLGSAATVFLDDCVKDEACIINKAPTSSTTSALVIGDMLAMTLMKLNGFTPEDFNIFHPGGTLGNKTASCRSIMNTLPSIKPDATCKEITQAIHDGGLGCVTVLNDDCSLAGFIANGDMLRLFNRITPDDEKTPDSITFKQYNKLTAAEIMTKEPKTITANSVVVDGVAIMEESKIESIVVLDNETSIPVGILNMKTCMAKGVI